MKTISLPADIFDSKPVVALSAEFGIAAQVVIIALLCEIAKNGYFIRWNDLQRNFLSRNTDIDLRQLDLIVARLVEYEYFDPRMFKNDSVLTSLEIQKRYFRSKKRREQIPLLPHLLPQIIQKHTSDHTSASSPAANARDNVDTRTTGSDHPANPIPGAISAHPSTSTHSTDYPSTSNARHAPPPKSTSESPPKSPPDSRPKSRPDSPPR